MQLGGTGVHHGLRSVPSAGLPSLHAEQTVRRACYGDVCSFKGSYSGEVSVCAGSSKSAFVFFVGHIGQTHVTGTADVIRVMKA